VAGGAAQPRLHAPRPDRPENIRVHYTDVDSPAPKTSDAATRFSVRIAMPWPRETLHAVATVDPDPRERSADSAQRRERKIGEHDQTRNATKALPTQKRNSGQAQTLPRQGAATLTCGEPLAPRRKGNGMTCVREKTATKTHAGVPWVGLGSIRKTESSTSHGKPRRPDRTENTILHCTAEDPPVPLYSDAGTPCPVRIAVQRRRSAYERKKTPTT